MAAVKKGVYEGLAVVEQTPGSEVFREYRAIADKYERKAGESVYDCSMVSREVVSKKKKGWPKENRELKKRVSLSVLLSLYEDVQKIAYIQRRSVSEVVEGLLLEYRDWHIVSKMRNRLRGQETAKFSMRVENG